MTAEVELRFQFPCTMIVNGASGSGKTWWLHRLLQESNALLTDTVDRTVWCYGAYQPVLQQMLQTIPNFYLSQGCDEEILRQYGVFDPKVRTLLILDDLHQEMASSALLSQLFCKFSHHTNTMVVFVTQNLYHKGSAMRDVTTNCHYLICLSQPRDKSIMATLARQMFPGKGGYFLAAYQDAVSFTPYGYLIEDALPSTPENLQLRSGVFAKEADVAWLPTYK